MESIPVSAEGLSAGYFSPVVEDICFNVRQGEVMTLVGPNGSGKSTLLKTLASCLEKLGGTVFFDGEDTDNIPTGEKAKKLSIVLTERIRQDLMTCRDVVETGRYPYTGRMGLLKDADRKAAQEAIEMVGAEDLADKDFSEISDGQRQRIMLARAICRQPHILILDEPVSYLDLYHKLAFLEILRKLADEKRLAVIISMHELELASKISDHVIALKNGRALYRGKPEDIFTKDIIMELFDIPEKLYDKYYINTMKGKM